MDKAAYRYESSPDVIEETNEQCSKSHDQTNERHNNTESQSTSGLSEVDTRLFEEPSRGEKDENEYSNEEEDEEPIPPSRRKGLEKRKQLPQLVCNYLVGFSWTKALNTNRNIH